MCSASHHAHKTEDFFDFYTINAVFQKIYIQRLFVMSLSPN